MRLTEGDKTDWYTISAPTNIHNGNVLKFDVLCEHISGGLKTKNLFGYFDDTNGIGTCQTLAERALYGTGWTLKECDKFYESDGKTEKIRTYTCDEKTGAWEMLQAICELFNAYPDFDGETMEVTIRSKKNHDGFMEVVFGKNTEHIERKQDSTNLVTRLYVQGEYTDDGFVGIEKADKNIYGLDFICNFDYFKEIGMFTDKHQDSLDGFIQWKSENTGYIKELDGRRTKWNSEFGKRLTVYPVIIYEITNKEATNALRINGATGKIPSGSDVIFVTKKESGGSYQRGVYTKAADLNKDITHVVYCAEGESGVFMVNDNSAEQHLPRIENATDEAEIKKLTREYEGFINAAYIHISQAIDLAYNIEAIEADLKTARELDQKNEDLFARSMGPMLREGYWSDDKYGSDQVNELLEDALELSKRMAYPISEWKTTVKNMCDKEGFEDEEFRVNQTLRVYDEKTKLKTFAYVEKLVVYPKRRDKDEITITTDETGSAAKSLENILSRITAMADLLKANAGKYDRAGAINDSGKLASEMLSGMIDLSKNKILSTGSNWYTDNAGNIIFVSLDEKSAMMLTGNGFMIANGKTSTGDWNWRTFGTGDGFTADLITTGFLSAERILAGSITANHLSSTVGSDLDLSSNTTIRLSVSNAITDEMGSLNIGASQILRGTNTTTALSSGTNATWAKSGWRSASSGTGTRTPIEITDAPNGNIKRGWSLTCESGHVDICQGTVPVVSGQAYTLSCYVRGTGQLKLQYGVSDWTGKFFPMTDQTDWQRCSYTFTPGTTDGDLNAAGTATNIYFGNCAAGTIEICGMKLEIGKVATDWTPATSETDDALANMESRVSEAELAVEPDRIIATVTASDPYTKLEESVTEVKQTADGLTTTVKTMDERVTTAVSKIEQTANSINLKVTAGSGGYNQLLRGTGICSDLVSGGDWNRGYWRGTNSGEGTKTPIEISDAPVSG